MSHVLVWWIFKGEEIPITYFGVYFQRRASLTKTSASSSPSLSPSQQAYTGLKHERPCLLYCPLCPAIHTHVHATCILESLRSYAVLKEWVSWSILCFFSFQFKWNLSLIESFILFIFWPFVSSYLEFIYWSLPVFQLLFLEYYYTVVIVTYVFTLILISFTIKHVLMGPTWELSW